ncbi:MAG: xanthine dehydrogenase family protein molybdopterin-binding subunit [Haliangiales bacterium]
MSGRYADEVFALLYPDAAAAQSMSPTPQPERPQLSRRSFLRIGAAAGGGMFVAVSLAGCKPKGPGVEGEGDDKEPDVPREPFEAGAYVTIMPDNTATITVAKSEMGQGVRTTLALIVAEELDLDWSQVTVAQAPLDNDKYGSQGTGGSASVRTGWVPLREAGAKARAMLIAAAAAKLEVPAEQLTTEQSHVVHAESQKRLSYGSLTNEAAALAVPDKVELKSADQYTLLGKEHVGVDVADIVTGKAVYGIDVRKPNMRFASIERSPVFGGKVKSFKPDAALAVAGVEKVVEVPAVGPDANVASGVAVIANSTWAAMQGRQKLEIEWDEGDHAAESSDDYATTMQLATAKEGEEKVNQLGDPDLVLAKPRTAMRIRYDAPFIAHATMEPQNCTAEVTADGCVISGPLQTPGWVAQSVAKALSIAPEKVSIELSLLGGGFGRRLNPDVAVEAALVAKQVDGPVQVLWTREDDMQHDFYRPAATHVIEASLSPDGAPEAWRHRMSTPAIRKTIAPDATDVGLRESNGASDMLYRVPHRSCEYTHLPSGVTRGWWRAVHTTHTTFAVESFIDELAEKAGQDPFKYRLNLIDELQVDRPEQNPEFPWDPIRLRGVLELAATKAGWGQELPAGHGVGIACGIDHLSYGAEVIEVSVEDGVLRIHKVVCAVDCGPVLNPNGARAQLEGGVIQGLSAALGEKITIAAGRVEQSNFDDYALLRINQAPAVIETHFAPTDAHPTGLGEPSVPPVAAALANAIYAATGQRPRSLPIQI